MRECNHAAELDKAPVLTSLAIVTGDLDPALQFVAQDELKYTPVGSTTNIRLSKAIDIIMKNTEEEKNREDNAKKIGKTNYSKVILKGSVNVDNFQNKDVTVTITKTLNGTVLSQTGDGAVIKKNSYKMFINNLKLCHSCFNI